MNSFPLYLQPHAGALSMCLWHVKLQLQVLRSMEPYLWGKEKQFPLASNMHAHEHAHEHVCVCVSMWSAQLRSCCQFHTIARINSRWQWCAKKCSNVATKTVERNKERDVNDAFYEILKSPIKTHWTYLLWTQKHLCLLTRKRKMNLSTRFFSLTSRLHLDVEPRASRLWFKKETWY